MSHHEHTPRTSPMRRRRSSFVLGAAVAAGLGFLVWAGWAMETPTSRNTRSWETAAPGECALLAQALIATDFRAHPLPLMTRSGEPGACEWRHWGLAPRLVTSTEFQASVRQDDMLGYIPHISLTAPRYSALRLRAAVGVEQLHHWEAAQGETCWFRRSLQGWRLDACRPTSVS